MQRSSERHYRKTGLQGTLPDNRVNPATSGVGTEVVVEEDNPTIRVYEPEHPAADADGYVEKPNINTVSEMANMMTASRAYEANISVLSAAKAMMRRALEI
jgi:flagellar basal-body rod protein FlgC